MAYCLGANNPVVVELISDLKWEVSGHSPLSVSLLFGKSDGHREVPKPPALLSQFYCI